MPWLSVSLVGQEQRLKCLPLPLQLCGAAVTSEAPEQLPEGTLYPREECAQDKKL